MRWSLRFVARLTAPDQGGNPATARPGRLLTSIPDGDPGDAGRSPPAAPGAQSLRRAVAGSMRMARRAGSHEARKATPPRRSGVPRSVGGSAGPIP